MTPCACSVSSLHIYGAHPCCPSFQVRLLRSSNLSERTVGNYDSVVVTLRSAGKIGSGDKKGKLVKTSSLDSVEAGLKLWKFQGRQSGVSIGWKEGSRAGPRRKPASEVQYRVQDAVDSGASTENGSEDVKGRYRDTNRRQRDGERRRRVQILGSNGVVDLEEHLGLVIEDKIRSREACRVEDTAASIQRVAATSEEEERRLLESTLLRNNASELREKPDSIPATSSEARSSSRPGQALGSERSKLLSGDTQEMRVYPGDVSEVGVADQGSMAPRGLESGGQNDWGKSVQHAPRALAELPGGKRVVELVAAWDALVGRLPPEFSGSSGSDLLLRALKLSVMAFQHTSPDESGRSSLTRALAIAHILVDLGMDAEVISIGLLRELVDSGSVSYADIEQNLGGNIARLLHDCSRVRDIPSRVEILNDDSATALRQFCLAFHDIRAVVVELASQLDVMRHIHSVPRYRQQRLALETMQIYAPLAHAIGTGPMAMELEDLGFRVLFPDSYTYIETWLKSHWEDGSGYVDKLKEELAARLEEDSELQSLVSNVIVSGRYKSRFSTMSKLLKDGRKPEEVYDVLGLRVIVDPKTDRDASKQRELGRRACYKAMEIATSLWQEVPGRLKDYIANRKENGYESLHLAVHVSDENDNRSPMEIQIRTVEMDAAAVSGEASHCLYKGWMTDPEQIRNLKLTMVAAATAAASRFGEMAGTAVRLEGGDYLSDDKDQMFKMFDKNEDGVISVEEFREVITELGADEGDALELMQIVDLNTDGFVSAEEFDKFRHQIQICQNLAGADKEYCSKLGWKLRGSSESFSGRCSLRFGRESEDILGSIPQEVEDNLESSARRGTLSGRSRRPPPRNRLAEVVDDQGNTSERVRILPANGDVEKNVSKAIVNESNIPAMREKPSNFAAKGALAGKSFNSTLSYDSVSASELEDGISTGPSTAKSLMLEDVKKACEGEDVSAEAVIDHELSKIRKQVATGKLTIACGLAGQLSKQHPYSTKAVLHHASLERKCGNLEAARTLYAQAIELLEFKADRGVDFVRALQAWASLEGQCGKLQRARHLYADSITTSEKGDFESSLRGAGVYGLHGWAMLEDKCGNWSRARNLLERAADLQPGNAVVHQSRASLEARAHNYSAARTHFSRAVKAAPNDVKCWHAWAKFEATRGNTPKMRNLFKSALEVDPKNLHSLQAWAHHEGLLGTTESRARAIKLYQDCVDINPDNVYCWQAWGILEEENKNYDRARFLFKRGLEANAESVPCLQAFAHMERKCGNLEEAGKLLRRALAIEPNSAPALMELALVEDISGNSESALELYKFAASLDKQKSLIKRRMFKSRKRELHASGSIPKPTSRSYPRIRKSQKSKTADESPRLKVPV